MGDLQINGKKRKLVGKIIQRELRIKHPLHSFCIKPEIFQAFSVKFEIQSQMELHVKTKVPQLESNLKITIKNRKKEHKEKTPKHMRNHINTASALGYQWQRQKRDPLLRWDVNASSLTS